MTADLKAMQCIKITWGYHIKNADSQAQLQRCWSPRSKVKARHQHFGCLPRRICCGGPWTLLLETLILYARDGIYLEQGVHVMFGSFWKHIWQLLPKEREKRGGEGWIDALHVSSAKRDKGRPTSREEVAPALALLSCPGAWHWHWQIQALYLLWPGVTNSQRPRKQRRGRPGGASRVRSTGRRVQYYRIFARSGGLFAFSCDTPDFYMLSGKT